MDALTLLQKICRQFSVKSEPQKLFSRIEKELRVGLGLQKALFLVQGNGGLRAGEKGVLVLPEKDPFFRRLEKTKRPAAVKGKWLGLWPVMVGGDWKACYALGTRKNGKALAPEEGKVMELLAERTALFLEERRLWSLLEKADQRSSLGFLSAVMLHEVRNPLTALNTLVQLLPEKKNDEKFMASFQKLMTQEIGRLTDLTGTFLGLSGSAPEKRGRVDLSAVVHRVTQLFQPLFTLKKVGLETTSPSSLYLRGEEAAIESLVMNLLKNALESTDRGGSVGISASSQAGRVRLTVKDNGRGIPKGNLRKIFEPAFSTKGEGAGLGLALCQKVVQEHHGRMTAVSPAGKGAVFTVDFPVFSGI